MPVKIDELKKILIDGGLVTEDQFASAARIAEHLKTSVTDVLLGRGVMTEPAYGEALAKYLGVKYVDLKKAEIPMDLITLIPEEMAIERKVMPFEKKGTDLSVAMADPSDLEAIEFVRKKTDLNIIPFLATLEGIKYALRFYKKPLREEFAEILRVSGSSGLSVLSAEKLAQDVSVIKIVDTLIEYAVSEEASDIHIEGLSDQVLVRYRIDGVLHDMITFVKALHPAIIARIKILSDLKLDETRLPQDGRIRFHAKSGDMVPLRVSILPTAEGEKIVLRILESAAQRFTLTDLGFAPKDAALVKNNISRPHGLTLVTGPTGSGKTTTLYTILGILNTPEVNISTIEDPVESRIPRINQTQVNPTIGLNFADGLRALLRQDPNIIMVGEIRDRETGGIAVNAAMTGHLVLSTLHTNDAPGAIPRLIDLGVEPFLISSTLNLVMAQRLVRMVCQNCKVKTTTAAPLIEELKSLLAKQGYKTEEIEAAVPKDFFKGEHCNKCNYTGFKGRQGIYEIVEVTDQIRSLIVGKAISGEIRKAALEAGMRTMLLDGLNKVKEGITTIDEVLRVTAE